ncbi:tripartite tricarboxylate transporter substrate binding protein [Pseudolabrys taiwanensis]|uniref:Tripartite tricarboxylate transporter substrate binding protein n=1 Tax=Pseudolabrys taiwanensis TaxID=331696 RepID=A0A345ZT86_9HYPH|nr:tripartite tricarboxylate transporter substrate binding protein [Pseudolabrys taiwanensis]AXK80133.1 tripartite tricarboxylate transporter substrate binding protein [Pseudolabrys taiwanensis]
MRGARIVAAAVLLLTGVQAQADNWPTKPIRVIIPFGAGSATDVIPRIVLDKMSAQLGQPIVVENRGGAGGTLGTAMVAKADPDGYTLLATSSAHTIAPALYPNLSYDAGRDFTAVGVMGSVPNVLIVAPSLGVKTVQEFVAMAKKKPGAVSFASLGVGSAVHMSAERFRLSAGYEAVHVPFKGGADALTEVMAGRVDYYFCPIATALPFIQDGKLLALAVSSPTRAAALPDVPTTLEAGFPNSDYTFWIGMFAPAKTPKDIVAKLNAEIAKAVASPDVKAKLTTLGVSTDVVTPAQYDALVKNEFGTYATFAKTAGMKVN